MSWTTEHLNSQVSLVTMNAADVEPGHTWRFLITSDIHWDNPKCDQDTLKRHLDEAKACGAGIIDNGDLFCAMQGKYDKRGDKSSLREEHQHGDYLDRLVTTATDFFQPYAGNLILCGDGNHETAIKRNHETDLTERLCATIKDRAGAGPHHAGYTSWVRFLFRDGTFRTSRTMWRTHGYGGGGPVTKDMIQRNRQQVYINGADIMVTGHTHDRWQDEQIVYYLDPHHQIKRRVVEYIKCPSYKDAYGDGSGGWEIERGHTPKPVGAWWVNFVWHPNRQVEIQMVKAK